jgi:mono/diheme cytochrome c family protein
VKSRTAQIAFVALAALVPSVAHSADTDFFEKRVRPIFAEICQDCHGPEKQKGDLRLDSKAGWTRGGASGPVITPGKPDDSHMITAVRYWDKSLQMPPKHALDPREVSDLIEWVKAGAIDPRETEPPAAAAKRVVTIDFEKGRQHWAFQPVKAPAPPPVTDSAWIRTDLDRFTLAAMEKARVKPAPDADRGTLLRRVTFDLTGLPPAPADVDAFLRDPAPDAYQRVVERLLASPQYGERWGRHWLDVVRYADTCGNASDYPVPQAYKYRDYVIRAFNEDLPFDQFIREQIAGDLLPCGSEEERIRHIIATGYLAGARHFAGGEGEPHLTIEDALDNIGRAFQGLSLSCARCHDHKFDPISTRDYYALYGILSSTTFPHPGSEGKNRPANLVPLVPSADVERLEKARAAEVLAIEAELKAASAAKAAVEKEPDSPERKAKLDAATKAESEGKKRKKEAAEKALYPVAYAASEGKPANARLQVRGDPKRLGEEVPRGFLEVLGGPALPADCKASGRLELANWIADRANPLTARVLVNRLWHHHFGRGIVTTPNDFGKRGQPPTDPALLDFLAQRFAESGWSIKAMHRLILLSHTWQQSTSGDVSGDPHNAWWSRAERRRLDAESIRDALYFVSGDLDLTPGGEHPFPPVQTWGFTQHNQFFAVYDTPKRAVYQMQQRLRKHPFFALFDGADTNSSTATRPLSTTPLQALFSMNDPFVHERANRLAAHVLKEASNDQQRVESIFLRLFARKPEPEETVLFSRHLAAIMEKKKLPPEQAWASLCRVLLGTNEFLYLD